MQSNRNNRCASGRTGHGWSADAHQTKVNGEQHELLLEPRVSLLDALREYIGLTGTKKGCNQGACGACTVLVDGERINACLSLAVDVPHIDIIYNDIPDPLTPMGAHGIGEIGITGAAAAIPNAVFNATGKRIRELPITLDKLLS